MLLADSMSFGGMLTGERNGLPWALVNVLPFNQAATGPPMGLPVKRWPGAAGRVRDRLLWAVYRLATLRSNGPISAYAERSDCRAAWPRTVST